MEEFSHLEGASAYSLDLDDGSSSVHSSAISHAPVRKNALPPSSDLDDIHNLANLQLSFDHDSQHAALPPHNHYEEDFEGMLDDLNRELPPHACALVSPPSPPPCTAADGLASATVESTIPLASSNA